MARGGAWLTAAALAMAMAARAAGAEPISWQEAVARLSRERGLAETCAAVVLKYGDHAAIDRGAVAYGEAKADYDGLIRGLIAALAEGDAPESLPDLQAESQLAHDKLDTFCADARNLRPPPNPGVKGDLFDLVGETIGKVTEAVATIWSKKIDAAEHTKATIQTQLEASEWPPFASVPRLP